MNELFQQWLTSGDKSLLRLALSHEIYLFLRAEKQPGFDYLYCQRQYHVNGLRRGDDFQYVGIYHAADNQIYDAKYTLIHMEGIGEMLPANSQENLRRRLQQDVRIMVEQRVGNDRRSLNLSKLESPGHVQQLEQYRKYSAAKIARGDYLAEGKQAHTAFQCAYCPEEWTEETLLSYIEDPLTYAEVETERYWSEAQEEMLLQFLEIDERNAAYTTLISHPENPVHIVRAIMDALKASPAKTVTVTIRKNDEEFTFKTEALELRRDCTHIYSTWNIAAADRRAFEKRFGRNADYSPEEIVRITYGKRTLYET